MGIIQTAADGVLRNIIRDVGSAVPKTWVKPSALKFARVLVIGGGGGGLTLPHDGVTRNAAGGCGGAWAMGYFRADQLPATVDYTSGQVGTLALAPGATQGGTGGASTFGSVGQAWYLLAGGGPGAALNGDPLVGGSFSIPAAGNCIMSAGSLGSSGGKASNATWAGGHGGGSFMAPMTGVGVFPNMSQPMPGQGAPGGLYTAAIGVAVIGVNGAPGMVQIEEYY